MSNKDNDCHFCKKKFSNKSILLTHQKTAKYCLEKQGVNNDDYKCSNCFKILTTQARLNTHINSCMLKLSEDKKDKKINNYISVINSKNKEIQKYKLLLVEKDKEILMNKQLIDELKLMLEKANQTISDIAKQPKTINTSNTNSHNDNRIKTQNNSIQTFDINDIKKISNVLEHHLTPEVLVKGQKGVAEMLKQHLLQNEKGELIYECTDVSRQKFEFINPDGNIETDPKATKLLRSLNNANIFDMTHNTGKKLWEKEDGSTNHDSQNVHILKVGEVLEIEKDSSKFRSHLANIIYNK